MFSPQTTHKVLVVKVMMFRNHLRWFSFGTLLILTSAGSTCHSDDDAAVPLRRIQFGSCVKQDQPTPIFRSMAADNPDLVLFLGDNIYADTDDMTLMRKKYDTLAANTDFQNLRSVCPVLATWDDHDYGKNDAGASFSPRRASQTEFLRFWKVPADSPRHRRHGIYHAEVFGPPGQRVQVILLDTRYFRSELKRGDRRTGGPYVADDDPVKTVLGDRQWRWLEQQLRVPAQLRLIASSIQFIAEASGQETWSNLPAQRKRMMEAIETTGAAGVIFVSGDRHWAELSSTVEDAPYRLYDLTSSSFNQLHARGTPTKNRYRHIDTTYHRENYGVIEIDWEAEDPRITMAIRDIEGETKIEKSVRLSELQP